VQLAVYDLSRGMAAQLSGRILGQTIEGIWHTGIRVYNKEFYFGGGIQCSPIGFFGMFIRMCVIQRVLFRGRDLGFRMHCVERLLLLHGLPSACAQLIYSPTHPAHYMHTHLQNAIQG